MLIFLKNWKTLLNVLKAGNCGVLLWLESFYFVLILKQFRGKYREQTGRVGDILQDMHVSSSRMNE